MEDVEFCLDVLNVFILLEVFFGCEYVFFLFVVKCVVLKCGVKDSAFDDMVKRVESGNLLFFDDFEFELLLIVLVMEYRKFVF